MRAFLATEHLGAVLLLVATVVALAWANSPWWHAYESFWHTEHVVSVGGFEQAFDLHAVANDGLMTIFFFVIGLEITRELAVGELADRRAAALPACAALGGMVVPALLFVVVNLSTGTTAGWGIPMATDIAFTLGVLALLGSRVPSGVKLVLLTLAVVDDVGAIVVIGVVYSSGLDARAGLAAVAVLGVVLVMRAVGVASWWPYVPVGVLLWWCVYRSGVHPTIAGGVLGLLAPARPTGGPGSTSVAERLETGLHPWSSYLVLPLFALANAGVRLEPGALGRPASLAIGGGVVLGLVVGKTVGIAGGAWLALRTGIGILPSDVSRRQLLGIGSLAGIGFTVSLFIAELAYPDQPRSVAAAKLGVLAAPCLAAAIGATLLVRSTRAR